MIERVLFIVGLNIVWGVEMFLIIRWMENWWRERERRKK